MFAQFVAKGEPPPLGERDVRIRDDPEWLEAAAQYRKLRTKYDELSTAVEEVKAKLIGLASHAKEQGGGVSVTRFWKRGGVDYRRVPELSGIDLDPYRSPGREELRLSVS